MSDLLPENTLKPNDLYDWYEMQQELKKLRVKEGVLRNKIFKHYFPDPKEGTNKAPLPNNFYLKGTYPFDRKVDEGALSVLSEQFAKHNIVQDDIIKQTPSLIKKEYNKLTDEQKHIVNQALIIKPGSVALEIIEDKKAKANE